jgi:hypothetical protein
MASFVIFIVAPTKITVRARIIISSVRRPSYLYFFPWFAALLFETNLIRI